MEITRDEVLMRAPSGATKRMGKIERIDPGASPKEIDLRNGEWVGLGIYELNGDLLRLIICDPGQPRPSEFVGTRKGMIFTLRRVSE
jgi:uncharacterized protein (TIGR03067 family)